MAIHNPHDRFAKEVLSVHANAADFLKGILPEEILSDLDLGTLKREQESYIDASLKEYLSDLVFSCHSGSGKLRISLLFEHKSSPPRIPHFQIMRYMLGLWETAGKKGAAPAAVIPVVLYHGKRRWKQSSLPELLKAGLYRPYVPDFKYVLIDLSAYSDREIKDRLFTRAAVKIWLLLQKHV